MVVNSASSVGVADQYEIADGWVAPPSAPAACRRRSPMPGLVGAPEDTENWMRGEPAAARRSWRTAESEAAVPEKVGPRILYSRVPSAGVGGESSSASVRADSNGTRR